MIEDHNENMKELEENIKSLGIILSKEEALELMYRMRNIIHLSKNYFEDAIKVRNQIVYLCTFNVIMALLLNYNNIKNLINFIISLIKG